MLTFLTVKIQFNLEFLLVGMIFQQKLVEDELSHVKVGMSQLETVA